MTGAKHRFSVDAFHRGAFHLVQSAKGGHRSGIDAMLLGAAIPSGFSGSCADLGSGAGAAGMAVVARCASAHVTLVENDPLMIDCAERTLALSENATLAHRLKLTAADVTAHGAARRAVGLGDDAFDAAILNPPFNDPRDRRTPDDIKARAHVMDDNLFEDWLRTVTAVVRPGGMMALIARPESLGPILAANGQRFGALQVKPILPHDGAAAIRIVIRGIKGSRQRLTLDAPHVLHAVGSDAFLPDADAINNGRASLFGD